MGPAGRRRAAHAALAAAGAAAALLLAEALLRLVPVPGVHRFAARFDPVVGTTLYPRSLALYRGADGGQVARRANGLGFLDRDHERAKPPGALRVGFFGDSYVEARQVPDEATFVRLVERGAPGVETFAFGRSGYGALASYLTSSRWAPWFDLDLVVYVFCENDPGDSVAAIKREPRLPSARPDGAGGFAVELPRRAAGGALRRAAEALLARSLVAATAAERLGLLVSRGVQVRADEAERRMATGSRPGGVPDPNDLPSTWPARWRQVAEETTAAVLRRWRDETVAAGRSFAVLYIPRETVPGEGEDSWRGWLFALCAAEGIAVVDPTARLREVDAGGARAFGDHLTREGHAAVGGAFLAWLGEGGSR